MCLSQYMLDWFNIYNIKIVSLVKCIALPLLNAYYKKYFRRTNIKYENHILIIMSIIFIKYLY